MSHDANKILMGSTRSSLKKGAVSIAVSDVSLFPAGTMVRKNNAGALSVTKADGSLFGVSLGRDLSDAGRIIVLQAGIDVPVLLTDLDAPNGDYSQAIKGQPVWVDDVTGKATDVHDGVTFNSVVTGAFYTSAAMDGVAEDGSTVKVALIDFVGGL